MGREKNTVEYFPFFVKDGKTIFALKKHYGIAGIGYFTQLLRYLSQIPEHWISMQDEYDRERFIQYMGGDESICIHVVYIMCATCKLDKDLFERKGAIVCKDFIDSLEKVYSRRSNNINMEKIREKVENLPEFDVNILYTSCKHIDNMLQKKSAKGKERKVKKTINKDNSDKSLMVLNSDNIKKMKQKVLQIFKEKSPEQFKSSNDYSREGKYIKELCEEALEIENTFEKQIAWIYNILKTFYYICTGRLKHKFLNGTLFIPSRLRAKGIWPEIVNSLEDLKRYEEEMNNDEEVEFGY